MYLMDLTELQYSTFMCALYTFNSKGEYGTTHRLFSSMSPFHMCMVANIPPSSADLLLYEGYPSFPVIVLDINARGYRLEHFPSIMHGNFELSVPQGPCIIFFVTIPYKSLSTSGSGISAHVTSSISFEHFPSIIHGEFGFSLLQVPCIVFFVITLRFLRRTTSFGNTSCISRRFDSVVYPASKVFNGSSGSSS
ncbi:unnamed protein product [Onchocerca ochengi]|uniref:CUB domain-containing protein n=1 Tax=Onchocerca ochengi TaxID=42157 RepID=A0A182EPX0_ONCOC|nr:unnamed protein product [Onchocerca ochengi]